MRGIKKVRNRNSSKLYRFNTVFIVLLVFILLIMALPDAQLGYVAAQSQPGEEWVKQDSGTSNWLNDITWGGSQFVAVGTAGIILTSGDNDLPSPPPVEAVKLVAEPSGRQLAGESITFTAEVTKGNKNAEFAFYYKVPGGSWTGIRNYSQNNTWTTRTHNVGKVRIGVAARSVGSDVKYEASDVIEYTIEAAEPVETVELTAGPSGLQLAGESITFTAEVTEGNDNAEYRFYYRKPGDSWKSATSYSLNNKWTVSTSYVGEVQIGVTARAVGSSRVEAQDIIDYRVIDSDVDGIFSFVAKEPWSEKVFFTIDGAYRVTDFGEIKVLGVLYIKDPYLQYSEIWFSLSEKNGDKSDVIFKHSNAWPGSDEYLPTGEYIGMLLSIDDPSEGNADFIIKVKYNLNGFYWTYSDALYHEFNLFHDLF